jgi:hypothetical protein
VLEPVCASYRYFVKAIFFLRDRSSRKEENLPKLSRTVSTRKHTRSSFKKIKNLTEKRTRVKVRERYAEEIWRDTHRERSGEIGGTHPNDKGTPGSNQKKSWGIVFCFSVEREK